MARRMRGGVWRQLCLVRGQGVERFHYGELRRASPEARQSRCGEPGRSAKFIVRIYLLRLA